MWSLLSGVEPLIKKKEVNNGCTEFGAAFLEICLNFCFVLHFNCLYKAWLGRGILGEGNVQKELKKNRSKQLVKEKLAKATFIL